MGPIPAGGVYFSELFLDSARLQPSRLPPFWESQIVVFHPLGVQTPITNHYPGVRQMTRKVRIMALGKLKWLLSRGD